MSDFYDDSGLPSTSDSVAVSEPAPEAVSEVGTETTPDPGTAEPGPAPEAKQEPEESPAVARFKSCRWYETQEGAAAYCSNRDVLPFAGKNGFDSEAWCPECSFFKVKRKVKKRAASDYEDYY